MMQKSKSLEEKLFDKKDWVPLAGAYRLIQKRMHKMPYELRDSLKFDFYVWFNGMYNAGLAYALYQVYRALK